MVKHKFTTGDRVAVVADKDNPNVRLGIYAVVRALPLAGSGPQYRVKHALDSHERVIDEAQLRAA
ncbi:MAG: hypothetical protein JOY63_16765 [Acetobacteraceae bacterium]|nr:hypothetical protein [Acetobacteraceae bacterium]